MRASRAAQRYEARLGLAVSQAPVGAHGMGLGDTRVDKLPGPTGDDAAQRRVRREQRAVKEQAIHLARAGRIDIVRRGEPVDPDDFNGVWRMRLKQD